MCTVLQPIAQTLAFAINTLDPNQFYADGERIVCATLDGKASVEGVDISVGELFCAFLQNSGGANASDIMNVAFYIPEHRCVCCGSVPLGYPATNNVRDGQLTFNYVT
jgi:hypothetical protein